MTVRLGLWCLSIVFLASCGSPIVSVTQPADKTGTFPPAAKSTSFFASRFATTAPPDYMCLSSPEPQLNKTNNSENVYLSGEFYLCPNDDDTHTSFDFDTGTLAGTESTTSDIEFVVGKAGIDHRALYYLWEMNNAFVAVAEQPGWPSEIYCKQQTSAQNRLKFILSAVGATGCLLTNEGRLASFRVERLDPFGLESVDILLAAGINGGESPE